MFIDFREQYEIVGRMPEDARNAPGLPLMDQVLLQIRDSLSAINRKQDKLDAAMGDATVRLVRLEERDQRIVRAEEAIKGIDAKVDALLKDKDQRDGASNVFVGIRGWVPVILAVVAAFASVFSALYLAGRATGVIAPAPNVQSAPR